MNMTKGIFSLILYMTTSTASVMAAQQNELDYDTLAACSIIYQEVGKLYSESGDTQKGSSFADTASAYAASALHVLGYSMPDPEKAYAYSEARMEEIVSSLNDQSKSDPDGDLGIISKWMPYCDTTGEAVNKLLALREQRGW